MTDEFIGDSFDFRFLLMKIARDIDIDIEPHPFLIDEFNEDNPVAAEEENRALALLYSNGQFVLRRDFTDIIFNDHR